MPPAGWTRPEAGATAASPLELSHLGESMYIMPPPPSLMFFRPGRFHACSYKLPLGLGATHGIGLPVHVYALYENAWRARRGQSFERNNDESARLYAQFAEVAERNEVAWSYGRKAPSKEEIATVTERNRIICFPCNMPISSL